MRILEQTREIALWIARQTGIEVGMTKSGSKIVLNTVDLIPIEKDPADELEGLAETLIHDLRKEFDVDFDYLIECGRIVFEVL